MKLQLLRLTAGLLWMALTPVFSLAQTVSIVNESTQEAVPSVYIYNSDRSQATVTNARGEASLDAFSAQDTLHFRHPGYEPHTMLFSQLSENSFRVALVRRSAVMNEVFISASKWEQERTEIPQQIAQIGEEQVRFHNPQTSADLLQSSGKVFVQKSQLGGGSPMMRGFAANSVLIAVDGVRMNNAIFRGGNLQNVLSVDPHALQSTELLFGPGSIIYGSDALGGVMNFRTKTPTLSYSDGESLITGNAVARYSSANHEQTFHADVNIGRKDWGALTSVSYSYFDDLRSGDDFYEEFPDFGKRTHYVARRGGEDVVLDNEDVTLQRSSGYQQLNLMQKVHYEPTGDWDLSYGFHYATTSDIPRYDRLIQREEGDTGPLVNAEWYYGPQIWMMNRVKINHAGETGLYDQMSTVLSHQWFQESRNDRDFGDTHLRNREENIGVYGVNVDFDKRWGEESELFYGVEGIYNDVVSQASSMNIETGEQTGVATRYPDEGSSYVQLAGYAKYRQDLSSNLTAVAGARYSHVMLDAQFSGDFYDFPFQNIDLETGAFSGSLGFSYRPAENLQFNIKGSTGFRAPNVDDVAKVFDSEPGTVIVPNANLRPEYAYNLDFTVIRDFEGMGRVELNTFYTWLEDAMVRRNFQFNGQDSIRYDGELSKVEALVNGGRAYLYGASLGFSADLHPQFALYSEATYTYGRERGGDPLRHVAPLFGTVGLRYERDRLRVDAYTEFNGKKDWSDFSPSERSKTHMYTPEGSPAWVTLNLKAAYAVNESYTVNAGVENILDKHYRPYSSGISAAGRNLSVTLRGHW